MSYKTAQVLKAAVIIIVCLAAVVGLFSLGAIFGPPQGDWSELDVKWEYGNIALSEDGADVEYIAGFDALFTPDLIKCNAYELDIDFPAGVELFVYYFDKDDKFIGSEKISDRFVTVQFGADEDHISFNAAGIRLCMIPQSAKTFSLMGMSVGNPFMKHKYADYLDLFITNKITSVDDVTGV